MVREQNLLAFIPHTKHQNNNWSQGSIIRGSLQSSIPAHLFDSFFSYIWSRIHLYDLPTRHMAVHCYLPFGHLLKYFRSSIEPQTIQYNWKYSIRFPWLFKESPVNNSKASSLASSKSNRPWNCRKWISQHRNTHFQDNAHSIEGESLEDSWRDQPTFSSVWTTGFVGVWSERSCWFGNFHVLWVYKMFQENFGTKYPCNVLQPSCNRCCYHC